MAAFALPLLHHLTEDPCGVFALVITPTRELATQLAEQFKALGSCLHLRCAVVVGGFDMIRQAKSLSLGPHVVVATPGRLKVLLEENPDIPPVFERTKLDVETAALHSLKSQALRLSTLHHFKSGQVSILIVTDVPSCGLDIPTVDLAINYDIPSTLEITFIVWAEQQELVEEGSL